MVALNTVEPNEIRELYLIRQVTKEFSRLSTLEKIDILHYVVKYGKDGLNGNLARILIYNLAVGANLTGFVQSDKDGCEYERQGDTGMLKQVVASDVVEEARKALNKRLVALETPSRKDIEKAKRQLDNAIY